MSRFHRVSTVRGSAQVDLSTVAALEWSNGSPLGGNTGTIHVHTQQGGTVDLVCNRPGVMHRQVAGWFPVYTDLLAAWERFHGEEPTTPPAPKE